MVFVEETFHGAVAFGTVWCIILVPCDRDEWCGGGGEMFADGVENGDFVAIVG